MPIVTLQGAELAFGLHPLLDRADLSIDEGERLGLIGRNGTGKSSLLNVIAGRTDLDGGNLMLRDGLRVVLVEQEPQLPVASTLRESLALRGRLVRSEDHSDDERERWRVEARLVEYMHRFGLDEAADPTSASGGEKKRAALALAFALTPDLLLLDEPTNHLDVDGITLVEDLLRKQPTAIVITHDRTFLDRVMTRIVELDRGLLRSYPGNFAAYETRKANELAAESVAKRKFDTFWKQEEVWIRKGIEARRTRNEGRVRRLEALRNERARRRERLGDVKLALDAGERSGKLVAELEHVTKRFDGRPVVRDLSLRVMRGDRLGLIGPNGAGKTTLLKLILGDTAPRRGDDPARHKLQVAYFDQLRAQLDPERTLADTISPGSEWIETAGGRKHVLSYLGDFLFPPQRANAPVKMLSGGERNRLLLARLFALPANSAGARRTDQRPRHRIARTARGHAAVLRRHLAPGEPRPHLSRQRRHPDAGRGECARRRGHVEGVRRRLQRLGGAAAARIDAFDDGGQARRGARARAWRRLRGRSSRSRSGASSTPCPLNWKRWSANSMNSPPA